MATVEGRLGLSLPIGLEGAGTVIAAGPQAKALEGRVVATMSGGMFAEFRKVSARDVIVLPDGRSAADGPSIVNAMTALGMAETAKLAGHRAILHPRSDERRVGNACVSRFRSGSSPSH